MSFLIVAKTKVGASERGANPKVKAAKVPTPVVVDDSRIEVQLHMPLATAEALREVLQYVRLLDNEVAHPMNRGRALIQLRTVLDAMGVGRAGVSRRLDGANSCVIGANIVFCNQTKAEFERCLSQGLIENL